MNDPSPSVSSPSAVAVIPARGGSKRIPRKNLLPFFGKPMIAWSIEVALRSGLFSDVVVSTDDDEIAEVAIRYGAKVPFRRPDELANDFVATVPVIGHAIGALEDLGWKFDWTCCIYATAPFVTVADLRSGFEQLQQRPDAEFVIPVTGFPFPIQRSVRIAADGSLKMFWPEHEITRSQDLEPAYHDAGQFYWGTKKAFTTRRGFFNACAYPVVLPQYRVVDIDNREDWERAEKLFELIRPDVV